MHEQSIVEYLLTLALENAEKSNARKIKRINLVVGDLTGVVEEAVDFYFSFLSKDTIAFGATLSFSRTSAELRCRDCDRFFATGIKEFQCPECRGRNVELVGGRELYIDSMEIE